MSNLNLKSAQIGTSTDSTKNFTLTAAQADGTLKLSRGNNGVTIQDVMSVASTGKVDFPQLVRSIGTTGFVELPGGLIIQWGSSITNSTTAPNATIVFPKEFPNACLNCFPSLQGSNPNTYTIQLSSVSKTGATFTGSLATTVTSGLGFGWFAIGN